MENLLYGNSGQISGTTIVSPTFANNIVKQGNTYIIRGLVKEDM